MERLGELLANAVAPSRCLHCRGPSRGAELLCGACRSALPWLPVTGCPRCGLPRPCRPGRCPAAAAAFAASWAPLAYEGPARTLAWEHKARATERVGRWLAAAMVVRAPRWARTVDGVVPVPADPGRRRQRGTDHARQLAAAVAGRIDRPLLTPLRWPPSVGGRGAQRERTARERRRIAPPRVVGTVPTTVLLVDDVQTTGATLDAAARALRAAGAERVVALTAFRAGY